MTLDLQTCTSDEREEIGLALGLLRRTVTDNPFVPITPTEPQAVFLTAPAREVLYGGAAGGGKSVALLAGALQYVTVGGYAALLLRRTFADLVLPDALIPLSHEWLRGTPARWDGQRHEWRFPNGATLTFGYLDADTDRFRYQGAAFQFIGFDELTQFSEVQYRYLFSRLRKRETLDVPLRMRAATNPGGIGHEWVRQRFIDAGSPDRLFIPARLEDNPYLDTPQYETALGELDPVTRAQLRRGDWDIRPEGNLFKRTWFQTVDSPRVPQAVSTVRCWDLAATPDTEAEDPDWLAGVKMCKAVDGRYYVWESYVDRTTPRGVEQAVMHFGQSDGRSVAIRIEQEGAASGKIVKHYYERMMDGWDCRFTGVPRTSKLVRAKPFSAACERGDVALVRGPWNGRFLDQLTAFPIVAHDDEVDAAVGAYEALQTIATIDTGGYWITGTAGRN